MSRIAVYDLSNQEVGEFQANCNRGWWVYGNPGVDGAGQTTVTIPDSAVMQKWLQLGRMVLIQRPPLPPWAGVIDTPWKAKLPVELTLYNAEYLFSLRTPETSVLISASVADIVKRMISIMNDQEHLYLSMGKVGGVSSTREETLDQRNMWDQLIPLLERSGHEMVLRPERSDEGQLTLFADVGVQLGDDTGFLLDDSGVGKNMTVIDAQVTGKISNRMKGVSGMSTSDDQLQSDIFQDDASQSIYRTRSSTISFRDITQLTTLNDYTKFHLAAAKEPYLDLTVDVMDVGNAFGYMRPGNRVLAHSAQVYLPGGVRGWRGQGRILAMAYDEVQETVRMKLRGQL